MSQQMGKSELILHFFSLTYLARTYTSRFLEWKGKRKEMKERRDKGKGTSETGLPSRDEEGQHCQKAWSWTWLPDYLHKTSPSNISTKPVLQKFLNELFWWIRADCIFQIQSSETSWGKVLSIHLTWWNSDSQRETIIFKVAILSYLLIYTHSYSNQEAFF